VLVAAAVCPNPPLIVPQLAGSAAPELDDLRTACVRAVRSLAGTDADLLVVVGGAGATASYDGDAAGTVKPWGVDVRVGAGEPSLPLSLTIGRWLLEFAGVLGPRRNEGAGQAPGDHVPVRALRFEAVAADASPAECEALGRSIARSAGRVAVLAMGDGSARLTEKSPGYLHALAEPYDRMLAGAIGSADLGRLRDLDPAEAEELWAGGRAAFQVLAAAAADRGLHDAAGPAARDTVGPAARDAAGAGRDDLSRPRYGAARRSGELLYDDAPYGVGYFVARWAIEELS
jgi:hypothetical protein